MWGHTGHTLTLRLAVPMPQCLLASECVSGCEPVLVRSGDIADIAYVGTMVIARVPRDTKFLFLRHVVDDQYKVEGCALESGHVALGVNGPLGGEESELFSRACKRVVQYEQEQRMLADAYLANARIRAREIIEEAETAVDEVRPFKIGNTGHVRELHRSFQ